MQYKADRSKSCALLTSFFSQYSDIFSYSAILALTVNALYVLALYFLLALMWALVTANVKQLLCQ